MKGFTLVELVGILCLLAVVCLIGAPVVINSLENSRETNRVNKVKVFAEEVRKNYMNVIAENNFYSFDGVEDGGINNAGVINFTNDWLDDNVFVGGINCNGEEIYSNVFYNLDDNDVLLKECVVDDNYKYKLENGIVIKYE